MVLVLSDVLKCITPESGTMLTIAVSDIILLERKSIHVVSKEIMNFLFISLISYSLGEV